MLKLRAFKGAVKDIPAGTNDGQGTWQADHDTAKGTHPHWVANGKNVTDRAFIEYVIKEERRHRLKEV